MNEQGVYSQSTQAGSLPMQPTQQFLPAQQLYIDGQKDEIAGVLLAFFLGSFGAHHFYLKRTGAGVLYLLFFWTGIPGLVSIVECFFMPGRVRRYNAQLWNYLASTMPVAATVPSGAILPGSFPEQRCSQCNAVLVPSARFCASCGMTA